MDKITTFDEYRDACNSTMLPSCNNNDYLTMGLIEEVGELARLVAKSIRGDYTFESVKEKAQHECGDIAYMLMELGVINGLGMPARRGEETIDALDALDDNILYSNQSIQLYEFVRMMSLRASILVNHLTLPTYGKGGSMGFCSEAWSTLAYCCHACGCTLKQAMNMNVDKLAKRKERGLIQGSGDHRECDQVPDAPYCGCGD